MTQLADLQFYSTPEHDCSYLDNTKAKTLFLDPKLIISQSVYSQLSELGFRRSGSHIYRPHCDSCQACISIRILVDSFAPSNSQKRVFRKNSDLIVRQVEPIYSEEYYQLYEKYINQRHRHGDMYPPSPEQFKSFLVESKQQSLFIEFRLPSKQLIAIATMDIFDRSLSAVYTFFDPKYAKRSLGTYAILWQIFETQHRKFDFLYLGYWVDNCQKMQYKTDYRPMELLIKGRWLAITEETMSK
ncbi:MAG: arginine-tRNA-protein transferase-related protein [Osedax symbiont Rs1]|nr:MAG: arginine-tRNA-protein transferase-related protein [Osedax symbiont Rs1]